MLHDFQKEDTELKGEVSELKKQSNIVNMNMETAELKQKYNHPQNKYKEKGMK